MLEKLKANIVFRTMLKRHDINKAYAMVGPEDSWYDTITTVHNALAEIKLLPHEIWETVSHDGLKMKAVHYPGTSDKTVIWIHGYTSHAERESAYPGLFYHSLGFNVLVPYLRAHGCSEGKYISFGPMERLDIQKWVDEINVRYPTGRIMLHGLSMGGGIALDLATTELENVKCLVIDAPSYGIAPLFEGIVSNTFKDKQEKILSYIQERFYKEFNANMGDFDRIQNSKEGKYPLLLTAGSMEGMEDILRTIKENNPLPSTVLILPGCNHGNGMYKQTAMYQDAIRMFADQYIGV